MTSPDRAIGRATYASRPVSTSAIVTTNAASVKASASDPSRPDAPVHRSASASNTGLPI